MTAIAGPAMRFRQLSATLPGTVSAMAGNPATLGNAKTNLLFLLAFALPTHPAIKGAKSLKSLRCRLPVSLREWGKPINGVFPPIYKARRGGRIGVGTKKPHPQKTGDATP